MSPTRAEVAARRKEEEERWAARRAELLQSATALAAWLSRQVGVTVTPTYPMTMIEVPTIAKTKIQVGVSTLGTWTFNLSTYDPATVTRILRALDGTSPTPRRRRRRQAARDGVAASARRRA